MAGHKVFYRPFSVLCNSIIDDFSRPIQSKTCKWPFYEPFRSYFFVGIRSHSSDTPARPSNHVAYYYIVIAVVTDILAMASGVT